MEWPADRVNGLPERTGAFVECAVRHRIGAVALDVRFVTRAPWTILFGPSGSGKSTVLRILAGLTRPDWGAVKLLDQVVNQSGTRLGAGSGTGLFVAAHRRPMRWSGQQMALFPRMTVRQNLAFGADAMDEVERALQHFSVGGLADKRPYELSGGEQRRVAVIRAALMAPGRVLLLDEPFTGLDAGIRDELMVRLRGWLDGSPVVSVTHDVGEALELGAEVLRLQDGRIVAQGAGRDVLAGERERLSLLLG